MYEGTNFYIDGYGMGEYTGDTEGDGQGSLDTVSTQQETFCTSDNLMYTDLSRVGDGEGGGWVGFLVHYGSHQDNGMAGNCWRSPGFFPDARYLEVYRWK